MKILIADDEHISRMVLERTLRGLGYEVDVSADGKEALAKFELHRHPIVIADWVMPEMDGIELCREIRNHAKDSYTYLILLTTKYEKQERSFGLSAGADDFIVKPFDRGELKARLGVAERILNMEAQLREANIQIQQIRRQEIEIGASIQRSLLMAHAPEGINAFEFAAMNLPSLQIDGDFFDFFVHGPDVVDVFLGDAMGKGVPAALLGAGTKSSILRSISKLLADPNRVRLPAPKEIIQTAHTSLARELMNLNAFVTLEYARLDRAERKATFVDCGHTQVLHWSAADKVTRKLSGTNFPIGFIPDEVYTEFTVPFGTGDVFCIYSDGVTEARSPSGELFGTDRLTSLVDEFCEERASQLLYRLREGVRDFTESGPLDDDFTVVVVKVGQPSEPWNMHSETFPSHLDSLAAIRHFVGYLSHEAGLASPEIDMVQLATHEAVTNVVQHAHRRTEDETIEIQVERLSDGVSIKIFYSGPDFRPGPVSQPEMTAMREGGLGLFIIEKSVDTVRYFATETGRKCIQMIKRIR